MDLLAQGRIKPVIADQIPLTEAARAHERLEQRAAAGKIVLICHPD
jgi:NADPH:quinone reductase